MDYFAESLRLHKLKGGKMEIASKFPLETRDDLSIAYTPGVAEPCKKIAENHDDAYKYTIKKNLVAVVSDGSAVLGLGNIGPEAALPVMEGKCLLFKKFGNVDAFPIVLATQDTEEIIQAVKMIAPTFGGINLEDISAPRCFEIEERLKAELDIPVFHDDQHGTAVVALAGLINALKITEKNITDLKFVFSGAGAAGVAIMKMFLSFGAKNVILIDSHGAIYKGKEEGMNEVKQKLAEITNPHGEKGTLKDVIKGADVFVGVSVAGVLTQEMVKTMNPDPIIFAMANPVPEIMPDEARAAGARIIATGRSDYPNQINNILAFPAIFRAVLDMRAPQITEEMKLTAAKALADLIKIPTPEKFIPNVFDEGVLEAVKNRLMSL